MAIRGIISDLRHVVSSLLCNLGRSLKAQVIMFINDASVAYIYIPAHPSLGGVNLQSTPQTSYAEAYEHGSVHESF